MYQQAADFCEVVWQLVVYDPLHFYTEHVGRGLAEIRAQGFERVVHLFGMAAWLSKLSRAVPVPACYAAPWYQGVAPRVYLLEAHQLFQKACDVAVDELVDVEALTVAAVLDLSLHGLFAALADPVIRLRLVVYKLFLN